MTAETHPPTDRRRTAIDASIAVVSTAFAVASLGFGLIENASDPSTRHSFQDAAVDGCSS